MLQVHDICKDYRMGNTSQRALDHVSLALRDNEFVAILGPSGSGKSTLLNVIGGLDRYDSGDLVINGTSTKLYSERNWDAYRNRSVGFIFQSYNLIPHQTILANVELALTISGVSRRDRTRRAAEALQKVGLGEHLDKRPNQLSGGQMQRVAVARALINEPEILLADEPTGALDSDTSIQVMELLKDVAKDRLVVMVTHNPELARAYATRIVEVKDGHIVSDSDPYAPEAASEMDTKRPQRTSMSFITALGLSFNNLRTKLKRSLLVAFAGSIGIIGIAMILSLSNGVNRYMDQIQRETLSAYPVQIQKNTVDLAALGTSSESAGAMKEEEVSEWQLVSNLLSSVSSNDLESFNRYLVENRETLSEHAQSLEYKYSISPLIFSEQNGEFLQVQPNKSLSFLDLMGGAAIGASLSSLTDTFHMLPENRALYEDQYEVKAGRWPTREQEIVLVLTSEGKVSDMALYSMGLKDRAKLEEMIGAFLNGGAAVKAGPGSAWRYEDFLDISFYLIPRFQLYTYDAERELWTDQSENPEYMDRLIADAEKLKIVGVVQPRDDADSSVLTSGMNYLPSLIRHIVTEAENSELVRAQLASPEINVLTGAAFTEKNGARLTELASLFSVDPVEIQNAFHFDSSRIHIDLSNLENTDQDLSDYIDPEELAALFPEITLEDVGRLLSSVEVSVSTENAEEMFRTLLADFLNYAAEDPATDFSRLPDALRLFFETQEAKDILISGYQTLIAEISSDVLTEERMESILDEVMTGFAAYMKTSMGVDLREAMEQALAGEGDPTSLPNMISGAFPAYLQTDEARQLIERELASIIAELSLHGISDAQISAIFEELLSGYEAYAELENLPDPGRLPAAFGAYLGTEEAQKVLREGVSEIFDTEELEAQFTSAMNTFTEDFQSRLSGIMQNVMAQLMRTVTDSMQSAMSTMTANLPSAFSVDTEALAAAITENVSEGELRSLINSLLAGESSTYEGNLTDFGYTDLAKPAEIAIYPSSFEGKTEIIRMIRAYNNEMRSENREDKVIRYSDLVGTMMGSVSSIVNVVSYVLIALVAVSLVVSSIMIGVITYISVLERKKEIGILRAIGASRRNVSSVFSAETFIIGAMSGLIGVALTELLLVPGNLILRHVTGQPGLVAALPIPAALLLIAVSIVLTLIGGFIPSKSAARSDPVTALRTE